MQSYKPLAVLPFDIQRDYGAVLHPAEPTHKGVFRLVGARRSAGDYEAQRITVLVLDENGLPIPNVKVAFAYSTAVQFFVTDDYLWMPPFRRAFVVPTQGSGQIDQIQGSVIKTGEPGGVTVAVVEPEYSSDLVTGAGMLADHTGLHLTFQLQRVDVLPVTGRLAEIERRLQALESRDG